MLKMKSCLLLFVAIALSPAVATAQKYEGKTVLYIDSYHEGFSWSDGILKAIEKRFDGTGIALKVIHMDTKRHSDETFIQAAARKAKSAIEELGPDVVIASDDNASKYVIAPYFKSGPYPVVFCGINWDASAYGFPTDHVTGMIEVAPVPQLILQLKSYTRGDRIGFIGPDTFTARKEAENYRKAFNIDLTTYYSKSFDDWKALFLKSQKEVDILIIDSDGGLYKDHAEEMKDFVTRNTRIPTGSCYDFMADFALITFGKLPEEQGEWAAATALAILDGTPVSEIPMEKNKQGALIINTRIAQALGIDISVEEIEFADHIIE